MQEEHLVGIALLIHLITQFLWVSSCHQFLLELLIQPRNQEALQKRYTKYHGMEIGEKSSMTFVKDLSNKEYKDLDFVKDA